MTFNIMSVNVAWMTTKLERKSMVIVVGKKTASLVVRPQHVIGNDEVQVAVVVQVGKQNAGTPGIAGREAKQLVVVRGTERLTLPQAGTPAAQRPNVQQQVQDLVNKVQTH